MTPEDKVQFTKLLDALTEDVESIHELLDPDKEVKELYHVLLYMHHSLIKLARITLLLGKEHA